MDSSPLSLSMSVDEGQHLLLLDSFPAGRNVELPSDYLETFNIAGGDLFCFDNVPISGPFDQNGTEIPI